MVRSSLTPHPTIYLMCACRKPALVAVPARVSAKAPVAVCAVSARARAVAAPTSLRAARCPSFAKCRSSALTIRTRTLRSARCPEMRLCVWCFSLFFFVIAWFVLQSGLRLVSCRYVRRFDQPVTLLARRVFIFIALPPSVCFLFLPSLSSAQRQD